MHLETIFPLCILLNALCIRPEQQSSPLQPMSPPQSPLQPRSSAKSPLYFHLFEHNINPCIRRETKEEETIFPQTSSWDFMSGGSFWSLFQCGSLYLVSQRNVLFICCTAVVNSHYRCLQAWYFLTVTALLYNASRYFF